MGITHTVHQVSVYESESMVMRSFWFALTVFVAFTTYTIGVMHSDGLTGFVPLAFQHNWGMQMLIDIGLSLGCFAVLAVPDARRHRINVWPYLVACTAVGSIAALAYYVHRQWRLTHTTARANASESHAVTNVVFEK